jgi:hypothetical protein
MNSKTQRFLPFLATTLFAAATSAQIGTLTLPAGIGDDPRSVSIIAGGSHVAICNQVDGWLHTVSVTNPTNPTLTTSYDPPYGDQWHEAEYTPAFGGRLFTGHRFGGLNMIDVSNPAAPVAVASFNSIYHYRGLRFRQFSPTTGVLYYNETNWGLQTFDVTSNTLTPYWDNFANGTNDGNGLELWNDNLFQFSVPAVNPSDRRLYCFDIGFPQVPLLCQTVPFSNQAPGGGQHLLRRQPGQPYILTTRWDDGVDLFDVSNPCSPVQHVILPLFPGVRTWGGAWISPTIAMIYGSITVGSQIYYWWYFVAVVPGPVIVPLLLTLQPLDTHDVAADPNTGRIYVVGRQNGNGVGRLLIY